VRIRNAQDDTRPGHSILELLCILPQCGIAALSFLTKTRHNLGDVILIFTQIMTAYNTTDTPTLNMQNVVQKTPGFSGRRGIRIGTFPGFCHHGDFVFVFAGGFQLSACVTEDQLLGIERWCEAMRDSEEGKGEGGDEKAIHHGSTKSLSKTCDFVKNLKKDTNDL
jgi:hypothetical protein